jgi:hypothetical protein
MTTKMDRYTPRLEDGNGSDSEDDETCWERSRLENALLDIEIQLIKLKSQKEKVEKAINRLDKSKIRPRIKIAQ